MLDVSVQHYVDARASPITWTMSPGREHEQADMNFGGQFGFFLRITLRMMKLVIITNLLPLIL